MTPGESRSAAVRSEPPHPSRFDAPAPPTVAVIGAGIAGLSAARRIRDRYPDAIVTVYESAAQVGGKLRRAEVGGRWTDVGAEAMLARRPEGIQLAAEAGLAGAVIHPNPVGALLYSRGTNHPLPARTVLGIPGDLSALAASGVVSPEAVGRATAERDGPVMAPIVEDVSIGELVEQRVGPEIVDRLVDPLLGGVYAGHARALSLRAAAPALAAALTAGHRSLLAAARDVVGETSERQRPGPVFASLAGGLATLPERLAADDRIFIRTRSTVRRIERSTRGFRLVVGPVPQEQAVEVNAVVLATPAPKSAQLLGQILPAAAAELSAVELASMVIVTLAFDTMRDPVGLPAGSGILVPAVENVAVKAMTFSSQKWPEQEPGGTSVMRASLGRAGEEWSLQRTDEELVRLVRTELAAITGLTRPPVDTHVQRWGGALPQYGVGHLARVARIRSAVSTVPGLAVCGAVYDGVGIPACIASAHSAADQVLASLRASAQ